MNIDPHDKDMIDYVIEIEAQRSLRRGTVIWIAIAVSEIVAYVIFWSSDMPGSIRYVAGWYTLIVGTLLLMALAVSLTVWLGPGGRLDDSRGWLLRAFLFWP